jgi:hypothetical protein
MNRYFFYICAASFTFAIGSTIALNIYRISKNDFLKEYKTQTFNQSYTERKPWEKSWKVPVQQVQEKELPTKPFCKDAKILPIWNQLIKDKTFKDWKVNSRDSLDCTEMLEMKEFDLNQDGQREFFLRGKNFNLCSPVGNCAFWIYEKKGRIYSKLLDSTDFGEITEMGKQLRKGKTRGYFDVMLKGHFTAADTTYEFYKFDGTKYKQSKCLVETPVLGTSDKPKWIFISCKEFFKS